MEEDLPHPDPESQYSGTNAHLEMLKDMLMTYNMYDNKEVGTFPVCNFRLMQATFKE